MVVVVVSKSDVGSVLDMSKQDTLMDCMQEREKRSEDDSELWPEYWTDGEMEFV